MKQLSNAGVKTLVLILLATNVAVANQSVDELTVGEAAIIKASGRDCQVIRLWPNGKVADDQKSEQAETVTDKWQDRTGQVILKNVTSPSLVLLPAKADNNCRSLVLLCPGGGYNSLFCKTVINTASWLNENGINVALLKYRVPRRGGGYSQHHKPLLDAQRAIRILRSRADEFPFDKNKIGIGGYSAGGHLAAALPMTQNQRTYAAIDQHDKVSCRPDFSILLYPAYLSDAIASRTFDEQMNPVGVPARQRRAAELASARHTPPTFIAVTNPDKFATGSLQHYLELANKKISTELHIYPTSAHGGGVRKYPFKQWTGECLRFMSDHGFAAAKARPKAHSYKAKGLSDVQPSTKLTLGDQRLRQIFGTNLPVLPVWPSVAPGEAADPDHVEDVGPRSRGGVALNIRHVMKPTLTISQPTAAAIAANSKARGRTVIVCPGGGYNGLAAEHEGVKICQWLNSQGITTALLKYRVPRPKTGPKHVRALQDLQRSIRLLRSKAAEFQIDVNRIGVCGFSAGGHLCTTLSTNYATDSYAPIDDVDTLNSKPNFSILIYPAYLTDPVNSNTVDPLLKNLDRKNTAPMFFASARDDRFTLGMANFFFEVHKAKVSAECHIYSRGGHGGGLDPGSYPTSEWTRSCERWLHDLDSGSEQAKAP